MVRQLIFDPFTWNQRVEYGAIEWKHENEEGKLITDELTFGPDDVRKLNQVLKEGDWVDFDIAIRKRTNTKHAQDIVLIKEAETQKEVGIICAIKASFGYISCPTREKDVFFHFKDLGVNQEVYEGEEVEFQYLKESQRAVQLKHLEKGTVKFEVTKKKHREKKFFFLSKWRFF